MGTMGSRLAVQKGLCPGFVIMHDHVHALQIASRPPAIQHLAHELASWVHSAFAPGGFAPKVRCVTPARTSAKARQAHEASSWGMEC